MQGKNLYLCLLWRFHGNAYKQWYNFALFGGFIFVIYISMTFATPLKWTPRWLNMFCNIMYLSGAYITVQTKYGTHSSTCTLKFRFYARRTHIRYTVYSYQTIKKTPKQVQLLTNIKVNITEDILKINNNY